MSFAENKRIVCEFLKSIADRDRAAIEGLLDDDGRFWVIGQDTMTKAQFLAAIDFLWSFVEGEPKVEIGRLTAEEDRVSVTYEGRMVTRTGRPYENTYHALAEVRAGKIVNWREYFDTHLVASILSARTAV